MFLSHRVSSRRFLVCGLFAVCMSAPMAWSDGPIAPFGLPDCQGNVTEVAPSNDVKLTVLCFLGTECPLANLYGGRLAEMSEHLRNRGVRFIGLNSNQQDSMEELIGYRDRHAIGFPLVKDYANVVADAVGAKRTPEILVLDSDFHIRYRGRVDDQYEPGVARTEAQRHELSDAIESLLLGEDVAVPYTDPAGCLIGRVRHPVTSSDVTFCDQVVRVLQRNCVECHRPGQIAPFSLTEYEETVGWGEMIVEVIHNQRMPPWHADHGEFANAREMPAEEKELLRRWVEAGMPYGDASKLPEPQTFLAGWQLPREPDQMVSMSDHAFVVPAEGTVEYQYFVVDPGFTEDRWVTGAEVLPGNRSVVHHSIVFVRPPDGTRFRGVGWLAAYVPGQRASTYAPGAAIFVPAKSKLVFQQHYTPNGIEQSDITTIGLTFGNDSEITHEVYTLIGIDQDFEIPPHASEHHVVGRIENLPEQAVLLSITPHMHLRGKSFELAVEREGSTSSVLRVPNYDFNWQHRYQLRQPIPLSDVLSLNYDVAFDNSATNPANPDPSQYVTWGDQTWEEMAVAFFEVSEPREAGHRRKQVSHSESREDQMSEEVQHRVEAQVTRILTAFDQNGDGVVTRSETPVAFRRFSFRDIDVNRDERLTRDEIAAAARWRVEPN